MTLQPHIQRTLLQGALILAGISLCMLANAQTIAFEGRVIIDTDEPHPVYMVVSDGSEIMGVDLGRTGNYKFHVPVDENVTIRIVSPGYITKLVSLDTHNARSKKVGFDLELEHQPEGQLVNYAGPVGTITFSDGEVMMTNTPQEKITSDAQASAMK